MLADGTVFEGHGFGAATEAVGEVCFNTAMTGYEEILTDPSYAGQIVAFTFPHIGIVGTNDEDIESLTPAVRALVVRADAETPSNYRALSGLDRWLKTHNIPGIAGIDTRALTSRIRENGMPHGIVAHAPDGKFDIDALVRAARRFPGLEGLDLAKEVSCRQTLHLARNAMGLEQRLWQRGTRQLARGGSRLRRQAQHPAPAGGPRCGDHRAAGAGEHRRGDRARAARRAALERSRRSRGDRRICDPHDPRRDRRATCRCSASASAIRCWRSRSAPGRARWRKAITAPIIR